LGKIPYLPIYPGDELQSPISSCSLAAQGLWLRLRLIMQSSPEYGHLVMRASARRGRLEGELAAADIARTSGETIVRQAEDVLAGVFWTVPKTSLIARMCGTTEEEYARLIAELDEAHVTGYRDDGAMFAPDMLDRASERKKWASDKRRQREDAQGAGKNGTAGRGNVGAKCPPNVHPSSSSSSSSLKERAPTHGKASARREASNRASAKEAGGRRGG
jgi:hypothetical protein